MKTIKSIKNLFSVLLTLIFNLKHDKSVIPYGAYCYKGDDEKNKNSTSPSSYYIISCPYYKIISKKYNGCQYLGVVTDDFVFDDQCKLCGENYNYNEFE